MDATSASLAQLEAAMDKIRDAPSDHGTLELIVRRPATDLRERLTEGNIDADAGLVGDRWHKPLGRDTQITLMNARMAAALSSDPDRWALAGDQLYVDLDLSETNLPPGTTLAVGQAVLEVTAKPHTGCRKFSDRFGAEALKFVNTADGRRMRLRGM